MRGMIHKVDGAFGAVHQFVARRGQGVREAVVPWGRCGCGRHRRRGSPDAIILEGVIGYLRGLGGAAERGRAHRRWLRRAAEARGRVVVARIPEVRRGAARR